MSKITALLVISAFTYALAHAADWLNDGGDPQRSGWQKREKLLNTANVKELQLLWKRQLDNQSRGLNSLTAPTLLGPIITHRGIKELVILAGASDNVYAVDADLGRVFWKRRFESGAAPDQSSQWPCGAGLTAAPAIAAPAEEGAVNEDEGSTPVRPVYVLASDGRLHTIRPSDGADMSPAIEFVPPNANSSSLNFAANSIFTTTSHGCAGSPNGVWAISMSSIGAKPTFFPSNGISVGVNAGVSIGFDGSVYAAFGSGNSERILSLTPGNLKLKNSFTPPENAGFSAPVVFEWKGRELIAAAGKQGQVLLLDAKAAPLFITGPSANDSGRSAAGLATSQDAGGSRWIYAATSRRIAPSN